MVTVFIREVDAILNITESQTLGITLAQSKPAKVETQIKYSLYLWKGYARQIERFPPSSLRKHEMTLNGVKKENFSGRNSPGASKSCTFDASDPCRWHRKKLRNTTLY